MRNTLCDKASNYIYSLRRNYVSSHINSEIGFLPSSLSNTEKQESSIDLNLSATSRPSIFDLLITLVVDHDNSQNKSGKILVLFTWESPVLNKKCFCILDIDSKSVQTNASTGNKRRCDSPDNRNEAHKRSKE